VTQRLLGAMPRRMVAVPAFGFSRRQHTALPDANTAPQGHTATQSLTGKRPRYDAEKPRAEREIPLLQRELRMSTSHTAITVDSSLNLHVGEWVEVRSAEEILATLDDSQSVSGLPFMPEMLQYCGKKFRVFRSAHKTADTIELFSIRRMANAVHLEELRCDGESHGGCQAGCLLFWKECWLKRVPEHPAIATRTGSQPDSPSERTNRTLNLSSLFQGTRRPVAEGEPERYRCQATEMLNATTEVRRRDRWDPRFYVKDLTSGNVKLFDFIRFGALAILNSFLLRQFGCRYPHLCGLADEKTPSRELNLQSGELVRVRTKAEIMRTLNRQLRNRGLFFDVEMVPYCGKGPFRVLRRLEKIINEKTGSMMNLTNPCIILDGVTCSGNYLYQRMFSQRHEYSYFREVWLERVDAGKDDALAAESSRGIGSFTADSVAGRTAG